MRTCDVLVIGAGIAGCSLACELAEAGASVVVAERGAVCSGSSALNAGGIRQQFTQETSVRAGMETVRMLTGFQEEFGVDPAFRQAGYLFLHDGGDSARVLERAVQVQNRCGVPTRMVGPDEIAALMPGINLAGVAGGAHNPTDGYVDPNSMVAGFAAGARARGATIIQDCPRTAAIALSNACALLVVSSHSRSGTESATMPAPACTEATPSTITQVRMVMARSILRPPAAI